jgi:hypothetical protein
MPSCVLTLPTNSTTSPLKKTRNARRYGEISNILDGYDYLDITVDDLDEIVPLPPAPLPPWDGQTFRFVTGQTMPEIAFYKPATGLLNRIKGIKHEFDQMGPGHWEWVEMLDGGNV